MLYEGASPADEAVGISVIFGIDEVSPVIKLLVDFCWIVVIVKYERWSDKYSIIGTSISGQLFVIFRGCLNEGHGGRLGQRGSDEQI